MDASQYTFFVRSDLVEAGRDEDGRLITEELFYVVAEDSDGFCFAHYAAIKEGWLVEKLCENIKQASELNDDLWSPIEPAYGSRAYQIEEPFIVAREEEDARNAY
jgi:hypothetical protein